MKEVQVLAWCDGCAAEIGDGDGQVERSDSEHVVALDGGAPRTLDLCERHRKQLLQPLLDVLAEYGANGAAVAAPARLGRPRSKDTPRLWQCIWCPVDYAAESGLRGHLQESHGFAHTSAAFGQTCPLCAEKTNARLGMHTNRKHGTANLTQAFVMALRDGDPHGVVAKRVRAGKGVKR